MVTLAVFPTLYHFIPLYGQTIQGDQGVVKAKLSAKTIIFLRFIKELTNIMFKKRDTNPANMIIG